MDALVWKVPTQKLRLNIGIPVMLGSLALETAHEALTAHRVNGECIFIVKLRIAGAEPDIA